MKTKIRTLAALLAACSVMVFTGCSNKNPLSGNTYSSEMNGVTMTFRFVDDTNVEMENYTYSQYGEEKVTFKGTYELEKRDGLKYFTTHFTDLTYLMNGEDVTQEFYSQIPEEYISQYISSMDVTFSYTKQTKDSIEFAYEVKPITFKSGEATQEVSNLPDLQFLQDAAEMTDGSTTSEEK